MNIRQNNCFVVIVVVVSISTHYLCCLVRSYPFDYPIANLSTTWNNSPSAPRSVDFFDGSTVRAILLRSASGSGPRYACGFYCSGNCDSYLFAIYIVQTNSGAGITLPAAGFPQVVWSANGDNPVKLNATLELTSDGDLILRDVDGAVAWSTNTAGKSVVGLNLTDMGNLVLFDKDNATVWQSFDHPTDSLVPGQKLVQGQELSASVSASSRSRGGTLFSLSVTNRGLIAYIESDPPQPYYEKTVNGTKTSKEASYVRFLNGSLAFYILSSEPSNPDDGINLPNASSAQYMKLDTDGHLRVYQWVSSDWKQVADLFERAGQGECDFPLVCGNYGLCSGGRCTCPVSTSGDTTTYFEEINNRQPALGCSETTALSCEASEYHTFLELNDTTYFNFRSDLENIDSDKCKRACLQNCSCKAALFRYYKGNSSAGLCYLPSEIFSLKHIEKPKDSYNSTVYLKVQKESRKKNSRIKTIVAISIGSISGLLILIGIVVLFFWKKKNSEDDFDEEDYLDQVPGLPTRFTYQDLEVITESFKEKLGEGGFGSVFEGTLGDGNKVAVKRLDGVGHIKRSFLAEVESIGSIHHVNLVRLIGFCAEKSHRLLVYEYMSNGSLDRWIFHTSDGFVLHWQQRKKIILDIAKGLNYLHEDCRQKIIHLDIKPQNILLDENFNAKVSDFGLSKLIDRDKSQVVTTMRGTPGYLAPEWLSSVITEKVDVYSFGVVIMEILCGRKNIDRSQPEEDMHLLRLFKKKAEEEHLEDLIDKNNEDMQINREEVVNMMKVAAWCLQSDFAKRPSMSMVIKVLEGVSEIQDNLDYDFSNPPLPNVRHQEVKVSSSTSPLLPSVLSGPR